MLNAFAIAGATVLGAITAGVFTLALLAVRTTDREQTFGFAAELPTPQLREPCPICGGRHCAGCTEPARVTSTAASSHVPRHDFDEVPPSVRWLAERVHVTFRGTLISAELVGHHVWRPADGTAFRLWAKRKLGRELQLGQRRSVVLP